MYQIVISSCDKKELLGNLSNKMDNNDGQNICHFSSALVSAGHCHYFIQSSQSPIIIPILQMRKLSLERLNNVPKVTQLTHS